MSFTFFLWSFSSIWILFYVHLYEAKFYFTRHSHVRNFHWRIQESIGGEYPQNALIRFETFVECFKMVDYAEFVRSKTSKTSNFTFLSKYFISIFFTCQVSACELQPSSCHDLANDIYSQTAKTVFSHLNRRLSTSAIRLSKWKNFPQFDNYRTGGKKKKIFHYSLSACAGN